MKKAHYIIFHPERQRQSIQVEATAMIADNVHPNWKGRIYVDSVGRGNEDPFVFNNPWLYSYCHASQLRRKRRKDSYLQSGSKIIFVSGESANHGLLEVDTVFIVDQVQHWNTLPLALPDKYSIYFDNNESDLWNRHFKFPLEKDLHKREHGSVSHTYEARLWSEGENEFSFIPLTRNGERVKVHLSELKDDLFKKISRKVKGKYPVLLSDEEIDTVVGRVKQATTVKVLKDIMAPPVSPIDGVKC